MSDIFYYLCADMRRFFAILTLIAVCFTASAQVEHSIVLDSNSFRAVQTDALTGVNIDPIDMDSSRQLCARVKIFFHRMTREQMEQLEPVFPSGTIDRTKCKVAEGNTVFILEFTAKPSTKFYLNHPTFGVSNEVEFDFEGGREYQLEASLNQTFSIVVNSNKPNVDIYLDNRYRGQTDSSNSLTIKDVMIGGHKLKVTYSSVSYEQEIDVNSGSISFRQDVNKAANKPQYVVFAVEPKNSAVTIDGQLYVAEDGVVVALLQNGQHNYKVEARGYHSQSGTVTVAGQKIERAITLKEDFATVTLTAESGADIYVNDKKVGTTSWSGRLNSGLYIFEARKSGYRTQSLTRQITSDSPAQSFALSTLVPIYGSVDITSTPPMADITIDGKSVGRTPLQLDNLLVGEHKLTVSKSDYQPYAATITIAEGKTATVNVALTKQATQTQGATPQIIANRKTSAPYKVGDYYNENGKQGVVFEVSADGRSGKIVGLRRWFEQWSSDSTEQKRLIGADSETDGAYNMAKVKAVIGWQSKYPAFKRCADLGEGWYLPANEELRAIYRNKDAINLNMDLEFCWSSTEKNSQINDGSYCAYYRLGNHVVLYDPKGWNKDVRPVATFGDVSSVQHNLTTVKTYKVGDYYTDGKEEGVVFEVSADGRSGKIVNLKQPTVTLKWFWSGQWGNYGRKIGADSDVDGLYNMEKVMAISGWQDKYPAFKWCADLGKGWYLPSIEELKKILFREDFDKINTTIKSKGGTPIGSSNYYWSSTQEEIEVNKRIIPGARTAHKMNYIDTGTLPTNEYSVRAVSTFGDNLTSNLMQSNNVLTSAPYKVGDFYNDGSKKGVVFEVSADGKHGKIISLKASRDIDWAAEKGAKRLIGADNRTDGTYNMNIVHSIKDWQTKYPAFRWCANLGDDWYIPSIEELQKFTVEPSIFNAINHTLRTMGYLELPNRGLYWSSTESGQKYKGIYSVLSVAQKLNKIDYLEKSYYHGTVRAVAKF